MTERLDHRQYRPEPAPGRCGRRHDQRRAAAPRRSTRAQATTRSTAGTVRTRSSARASRSGRRRRVSRRYRARHPRLSVGVPSPSRSRFSRTAGSSPAGARSREPTRTSTCSSSTTWTSVGTILGGYGADLFDVFKTPARRHHARRRQGRRHLQPPLEQRPPINVTIHDSGNPWNSGDKILVDGTTPQRTRSSSRARRSATHHVQAATTPSTTRRRRSTPTSCRSTSSATAATTRSPSRARAPPCPSWSTAEPATTSSPSATRADGLNDIVGISRPNVNQPDGVGPVQIVGGSGHDTLVVDDSGDHVEHERRRPAHRRSVEARTGSPPSGDEVGIVSGFGMKLCPDGKTFHDGGAAPRRRRSRRVRGRRERRPAASSDRPRQRHAEIGGDAGLVGSRTPTRCRCRAGADPRLRQHAVGDA